MASYDNTDPWRKFRADHGKPRRDNWYWRSVTLIVFALIGAVIAAVAGALLNPRMPGQSHMDNLLFDSWGHVVVRMAIGATAGMAVGVAYVVWCWLEMKAMPPRRRHSFRD